MSGLNNCGVFVSDTSSQLILQAAGLKPFGPKTLIVLDERKPGFNLKPYLNIPGWRTQDATNKPAGAFAYPNPAQGYVAFDATAIRVENIVLKIVNGNGQTMYTVNLGGKKQALVATGKWAGGLYLYSFTNNGQAVSVGKFVVSH